MSEQLDLPTYPVGPGYQHTDTSRDAAASMMPTLDTIRYQCFEALRVMGNATADEVADRLGLSVLTVRPRITELKRKALIVDTGIRRTNRSGRYAAVMRIITYGDS